jgi:hypothetical protein
MKSSKTNCGKYKPYGKRGYFYHSPEHSLNAKGIKTKIFDDTTIKGIKDAEKFQWKLYKKFDKVTVEPKGFDKVVVRGENLSAKGSNPFAKARKVDNPYEVWGTPDKSWECRVLKKYQIDDNKPYARWFVATKSPFTFGSWEYGDQYVTEIKQNFVRLSAKGKRKTEYIVMNDTDGIVASPDTYKSKAEAQKFINNFPKRFDFQGYYFTSNMERINPKDVKLRITKSDKF